MGLGWGFGDGKSISVFDHIVGKPIVSELIHGKDYSGEYAKLAQQTQTSKALSHAALIRGLSAIRAGYGGAQSALAAQGGVATKQILDREKQTLADNQQSLISRGLYDSTALEGVNRGTIADTNESLAALQAMLGEVGSNIKIQQGNAEANIQAAISGNELNYQQLMTQIGLNTEYGQQGGFGGAIMGLLGMIFGGGFGAAAGAAGGAAPAAKSANTDGSRQS